MASRAHTVTISHDAFGRWSLLRRSAQGECDWCCAAARWEYGTESDGLYSRTHWDGRQFCSSDCRRAYYDEEVR